MSSRSRTMRMYVATSLRPVRKFKAKITAAQAGKEAVQADVTHTLAERNRQEALLKTNSSTQQKVEPAVAVKSRIARTRARLSHLFSPRDKMGIERMKRRSEWQRDPNRK